MQLTILSVLTGLEEDDTRRLAIELIDVGLGEDLGYGHLRLDPALAPYLRGELAAGEADALQTRWAEAMAQLTGFLYQQRSEDAHLAAHLTLLELPNLLAMLERLEAHWPAEMRVSLANCVERLLAHLGRPQALARASRARERARAALSGDGWSHARFVAETAHIDRLLEQGDLPAAHEAARRLLERSLAAGEDAFPAAAYDLAIAYIRLGRVLEMAGAAEDALVPLREAQRRFERLADTGDRDAEGMTSVAITGTGDCLCALGRLDEAGAAYEDSIARDDKRGDRRGVAVSKCQLGTVRLMQERHAEALASYTEARITFEALNEPRTVATAWHQIGMVHQAAGQLEDAEDACRRSLAITVRENDLAGQASTVGQLGNLYGRMSRREDAVTCYRQCVDAYVQLGDLANEGISRSHLAKTLIELKRHDEARRELHCALECKARFGHAVEPWTTWAHLANLERDLGQRDAADSARRQAIALYLAYRRDGGVSRSNSAEWFEGTAEAIRQHVAEQASKALEALRKSDQPSFVRALISALLAVLAGERDPALAGDADIEFVDAVELLLLLEQLADG